MSVLGIDVGGTKTIGLLGDAEGRVVAKGEGPGANLQSVGELEFEKVLHSIMEQTTGHEPPPVAVCLGIAGVDRKEDAAVVHSIMRRICSKARVLVVNDALIALEAGVGSGAGVVIVAGTGSIAYGRDGRGFAARAGGWGHILGDEGSGYWIGRRALRAIVRQADGRSEPTILTGRVLAHFGVQKAQDLIRAVYHHQLKPADVAALAPHVQSARDDGDPVAALILQRAAEELAGAAAAVTTQLELRDEAFTFVLAGGMFHAVPWLRTRVATLLSAIAARSTTLHLSVEPALGAVSLALAEARGGVRIPLYKTELDSGA